MVKTDSLDHSRPFGTFGGLLRHAVGRPSVITDDLMQAVETKIRENSRFTIYTLSLEFPVVSRSAVYKIVTEDLNFKKLCSQWLPRQKGLSFHWSF
ncbi:uncharacterized protein TNCV_4157961 [Trichonephila clavipes]|nr:uncharacterized protein TNCV_4157961 [Trichonephila clavipes]